MQEGYIKLYRKIKDWEWYDDVPCRLLFLHLLVSVNWRDTRWQGVVVKRGQIVTSLSVLANEVGVSIQQLRTAIKKLISTADIKIRTTNKYHILTVCNYECYQVGEQAEQQTDNKRATCKITNEQQTDNKRATNEADVLTRYPCESCEAGRRVEQQTGNKRIEPKATRRATTIEEYKEEYNIYTSPPPVHVCAREPSLTITAEQAETEIVEILDTPDCAFLIHQRSQMSASEVRAHIEEFATEARVMGKTWRNRGDLTQNLANWMAIKKQKLTKQQNCGDTKQAREQAIDDLVNGKFARALARSRQGA